MTAGGSPDQGPEPLADAEIIRRIQGGDESGLRSLLDTHGRHVKGLLIKKYGGPLEPDIEAAIQDAVVRLWQSPDRFDASRSPLRGYLYILSRTALLATLRLRDLDWVQSIPDLSRLFAMVRELASVEEKERLREELGAAVEQLSDMQCDIIKADLDESTPTDNAGLATKWNTTTNVIHVSRKKAHKRLRRILSRGRRK